MKQLGQFSFACINSYVGNNDPAGKVCLWVTNGTWGIMDWWILVSLNAVTSLSTAEQVTRPALDFLPLASRSLELQGSSIAEARWG